MQRQAEGEVGGIILIAMLIVAGSWFYNNHVREEWLGFYYPNGISGVHELGGPFKTQVDCQEWGYDKYYTGSSDADFECGKNCKVDSNLYICKETIPR